MAFPGLLTISLFLSIFPLAGSWRLQVVFLDIHSRTPPLLEVEVNGRSCQRRLKIADYRRPGPEVETGPFGWDFDACRARAGRFGTAF